MWDATHPGYKLGSKSNEFLSRSLPPLSFPNLTRPHESYGSPFFSVMWISPSGCSIDLADVRNPRSSVWFDSTFLSWVGHWGKEGIRENKLQ